TIRKAFEMGVEVAGADRLITRHRTSLIQLLPASYEERIERVEGVAAATPATWFGGSYKDERMPFARFAVKPDEYLEIYPEYVVSEEQQQAWMRTRTGVIVGRKLSERFGFEIGDKIQIVPDIWRPTNAAAWEFDVVGIYDGRAKETDLSQMLLRIDYLDEARQFVKGQVGWYGVKIEDPNQAAAVAERIDKLFENSPAETKTATEAAFMKSWADQVGDIGAIVTAILSAVFFTILLVAGNTMAQAVRERISELGVLKAIGYTDGQMLALVLVESLLIAIVGGGLGLLLGWLLVSGGDPTGGALPVFFLPPDDIAMGAIFVIVLGLIAGAIPALQAMRLNPVDALRRE
ncbi:MAG TPA: FtsX-like permease family protein, partial [Thermoanaerobaculia bacterium]|nr:FtsX-like permease family protein [Thermoanaerobaculia bacterium]